MTTDPPGWPVLTDEQRAKRRRWLARDGVLYGQINWIACKLEAPKGPPRRLTHKDFRQPAIIPLTTDNDAALLSADQETAR